jgi:hypothetical protein
VVDVEALLDRLGLVVVALDQRRAVDVAAALVLGRVELDVVDAAGLRDAPAGQAADDLLVGRLDQQHRGELPPGGLQVLRERVGLGHGPREAVEQEAVGGLVAAQAFEDHADDHVVGNEVAGVHVLLGLAAELGPLVHRLAQDVPRREVRQVEVLGEALGLGALAGTGRTKEDQVELGHDGERGFRVAPTRAAGEATGGGHPT